MEQDSKNDINTFEQKQLSFAENHVKFMTSRVYFIIALISLVGIVITTLSTLITFFDLKILKSSITSPFQGIWTYSSVYQKYYNESDPDQLRGVGEAVLIWNSFEKHYDIFIGYQINKIGATPEQQNPLASLSMKGSIEANIHGFPENNFKIGPLSLIARLHYANEGPADGGHYRMTNCRYDSINQKPIRIECNFKTSKSESVVEFTRKKSFN